MKFTVVLLAAALASTGALAAGYSEKKSGDLSDDGLDPTSVKLKVGANIIDGDDGADIANGPDRDYFTIQVEKGQTLESIVLDPKTRIGGLSSFIGVQKGKKVTVDPNGGDPSQLLGWTHFHTSDEGTDILPAICQGFGAQGCTPPLGPGKYSFWVQELSVCKCHYRFIFNLSGAAQD